MYCKSLNTAKHSNCPSSAWKSRIYDELHREEEMVMVNVGANSGSNVNEFLLEHDPGWKITPSEWHRTANMGCGVCGACRANVVRGAKPLNRVRILAVELLLVNFLALSRTFDSFHVPGIALNAAGGSRMSWAAAPRQGRAGVENMGIAPKTNNTVDVPMVSVDGLLSMFGWATSPVDFLSIDTEGNDAFVLRGAREGFRTKRFRVVEFEYHGTGAWSHLRLNDTVADLASFGYTCFWQGNARLAPYEKDCPNEIRKWSNLVCAHELPIVRKLSALTLET